MSYICYATGKFVQGEGRELIPTKIRKVTYIAQVRPDKRVQYLQFAGQTEGWEVVEEVPVRHSAAASFKETHKPEIIEEKEVRFLTPKKPKIKQNRFQESDNIQIGREF